MSFELPDLPFAKDALAPHMSSKTLEYHHGKHHNAYVNNLNKLIEGSDWENRSLEEIILEAQGGTFNNGAQHYNHSFFWKCLKPGGGGKPQGDLLAAIEKDFESFDRFAEAFSKTCATHFGSGWGWLVMNNGKLELMSTANADTPIKHGVTPLLTIDVWEHAYYIDYRNARPKFIETVMNHLVNWDFVAENFAAA